MSQKKHNKHDLEVSKLNKLFARGVSNESIKKGLLVLKEFPKSYILHNIMGLAYAANARFDKAEDHYKKSIKLNPYDTIKIDEKFSYLLLTRTSIIAVLLQLTNVILNVSTK